MRAATPPPAQATRRITLPSGTLDLELEAAQYPVEQLLSFAARHNPKRGFLFVSRVLGKHIPVAPRVAQATWQDLAAALPPLHHPHFIGLAETATALGEGVYQAWQAAHPTTPGTFQHTTRYLLDAPTLLRFDEPHSHAPAHLLYDPGPSARSARELVLVDDELSTGTTLENLARAWAALHPHVERVVLVSLTDWCVRRAEVAAALKLPVAFVSLTRGTYRFTPDLAWHPPALNAATGNGHNKTALLSDYSARLGRAAALNLPDIAGLAPEARVLVLGTGEYQFPAAQLALHLEQRGFDVRWSATTRSPVLPGLAITRAFTFEDNVGDQIPNFLYNVFPEHYDLILVTYEGQCWPSSRLMDHLGRRAQAVRLS